MVFSNGHTIMRYVQLRAFHNVALHGGFSRAAEALSLTQPAISDQVRKLEEEYGIILFNRHRKRIEVTAAGRQLLEITHRLFENEAQALDLLTESSALRSGTLRIVADSAHHVLRILARFREAHPGVRVTIGVGNSAEVIAKLHAYEADVGVLGEVTEHRDFDSLKLSSTPLIAFVADTHRLAKRRSISLATLAEQALAVREPGSKTREKFETALAEQGLPFDPAIEVEGREAVRDIVASGTVVGIVSAAEFNAQAGLVPLAISDAEILMDEALICLRDRSGGKLVKALFEIALAFDSL